MPPLDSSFRWNDNVVTASPPDSSPDFHRGQNDTNGDLVVMLDTERSEVEASQGGGEKSI